MVQGNLLADLFSVSFCSLSFLFYSSFPMNGPIACVGVGFALSALIPFFFFTLPTSVSMTLTCADPALAGVGSHIIYNFYYRRYIIYK